MKGVRVTHQAAVLVLLLPAIAMNASPTMVLCRGENGHVAIEPIGHNHCAEAVHDHGSDEETHHADMSLQRDDSCCPCDDFPMLIGVHDKQKEKGVAGVVIVAPAFLHAEGNLAAGDLTGPLPPAPPPCCLSLRSIVLQV